MALIVYWLLHPFFCQIKLCLVFLSFIFNLLVFVGSRLKSLINLWLFISVNWISYFSTMLNLLQPYFFLILEIHYPVVWLSALEICGSLLIIVIILISQIFLVWNVGVIVCEVFASSLIAIISDALTGWWFITTSKDLAIEILWAKSWSQTYLSTSCSRLIFWNVELVLYYGLFNGLQIFGSVNTVRQYLVGIST